MLKERGGDEKEENCVGRSEEENELRWKMEKALFEDNARNTEAEATENDESIAKVKMEAAVDITKDDDKDSTEHEEPRCEVFPPEAFVEERDSEKNSEKCFCFSDEFGIHRFCSSQSHVPEPEACDDQNAEEHEQGGLPHREGKELPQHGEESVGEEDEDDDGNLSDKEHGEWRENRTKLSCEDGECGSAEDREKEEEVSLPASGSSGGHGVGCFLLL